MSFLDRFRKKHRRVEDPTFGELTYDHPWWSGWDDAMFNVAIEGWTPRGVSLDD